MVAELSEVRAALRGVSRMPLSATYFRAGTVAAKSVNRRMRVQSLMIARLADGERYQWQWPGAVSCWPGRSTVTMLRGFKVQ